MGYFQVDNRQVKILLIKIHYLRSQRRKWWCYGVGPLGRPWTFRFRSISLKVLVRLSSNLTHNTSRGSSCAFRGMRTLTYFWFRTMTYLDVLTHTSFPEQISKSIGRLQSYCTYMFFKVPSCAFSGFWTLTLKLTQHFDLIYNIRKSNWNILRNIMKTTQDSYTITIKQIVSFQERMHLKKIQDDKNSKWPPIGHYSPRQASYCGISWKPLKIATPLL